MKDETENKQKIQMKRLLSLTRKAVQDYDLISEGDKVCVGLSGGKDSLTLLSVMACLRRFLPKKFELCAATVSLGFKDQSFDALKAFCEKLDVEYRVIESSIAEIVFDIRKETRPCALCANLRRGAVNDAARTMGANVVALAHHKDDVIETAILSLFFEGRFYCFDPKTWLDRAQVSVIRPFIYVQEKEIKAYASSALLPILHNPCPMDRTSERSHVKDVLGKLEFDNTMLRTNIFGAVKRNVWNSGAQKGLTE